MRLCIFEDRRVTNLAPLVYSRPVYSLRCGALSLFEKIQHLLPKAKFSLHVRPELTELTREEYPGYPVNSLPEEDTWLVNGRVIADERLASFLRKNAGTKNMLVADGELIAVHVGQSSLAALAHLFSGSPFTPEPFDGLKEVAFEGSLIRYSWDLIRETMVELERDFGLIHPVKKLAGTIAEGAHLLGKRNIIIGKGSVIQPGVVLDAVHGPIIIGTHVTIMSNAVIQGPACIGDNSIVKIGAKIYHGTSIGRWCKVGGEIEASVVHSHSNKQHDGFLGHSYIGSWVNLGADTNTSDLKNTYGHVSVDVGGEMINTGEQFVGLTMGDHSKTGINVMFDTGTVVGVSANIYGAGLPPKFVPSFAWGEKNAFLPYDLEKSVETARKVMMRRDVTMSEAYERMMRGVYVMTESERRRAGVNT